MKMKVICMAAAVSVLTTGAGLTQGQNEVKGWVTRPKPPAVDNAGDVTPGGPKTITRGADDAAPVNVVNPPAQVEPDRPPAPSGRLMANDAQGIFDTLRAAGHNVKLETDSQGWPKIVGTASRSTYWILFLDCDTRSGCLGIEFFVSYSLTSKPGLDKINDFNNRFRYIRAFNNAEGNPRMMMDVLMQNEGIDPKTFLEYVRLWGAIMPEFEKLIGV